MVVDKVGGSLTFTPPARPLGQRLRLLETPLETLCSAFDSSMPPKTRRIFFQRKKKMENSDFSILRDFEICAANQKQFG